MNSSRAKRPLVMITGAVPGLGKSRLARELSSRLAQAGYTVDLFQEEDILRREEFVSVMRTWEEDGIVPDELLLASTAAYLQGCLLGRAEVIVMDSLLPYLPSLLAWGRSDMEICEFLAELNRAMAGFNVLHLHLEGDAALSLQRAVEREHEGWLARFVSKVGSYRDEGRNVVDVPSVVRYLQQASSRSHRLLQASSWPVSFLGTNCDPEAVLSDALNETRACLFFENL